MTRRLRPLLFAALIVCSTQSALAAPTAGATEEEKRAAQKMFEAGDGLYESGRFDDAISAFKNSHQLVASPNSRLMLARSLREAGHNTEACEEFRGTIRDAEASGGRYPEALQAAQAELGALEEIIAKTESNKPPTTIAPAPPSAPPKTQETPATVKAAPLNSQPPSPSNPLRWAAWGSAGVGVVGLAAFGVFGYLNHKAYGDLESSCSRNLCPPNSADKIDDGRRYQLIANVGLGVAAVGAIAATTLFVLSPRKEPGGANVALQVTPSTLLIDGSF